MDRLWLVDASSVVHRMYHALPLAKYTSPDGRPVGALAGWVRELRTLRGRYGARWILPVFDGDGPGWRSELFPGYKQGRPPHPPELDQQLSRVVELTTAMRLQHVKMDGVEADDLIAAYTEAAVAHSCEVVVVSNDKDLMQLVRGDGGPGSVRVLAKRDWIGPSDVSAKFGVGPDRLADLLALAGDPSDSIPGIAGVGTKTAARLLAEHGDLEQVLDRWALVPGRLAERIRDDADAARLGRLLVGLHSDMLLPIPLDEIRAWVPSRRGLDRFFAGYGYPRFESAVDPAE